MKLIFLGGTRFIGQRAVRVAQSRGHSIFVLHRGLHNATLPEGIQEIIVDRNDGASLSTVVKEIGADVLIDTFAMTKDDALLTVNAIAGKVPSIVILSSQDVYAQFGRLNGHPVQTIEEVVTESSPLTVPFPFRGLADHDGGSNYDKKDVEAVWADACKTHFKSVTILRLPCVFGSGDHQRRLSYFVETLSTGIKTLPCQDGASWRCTMGHVENMAQAIVLSAEKSLPAHHVFNVGERHTPTMRERIEKMANALGAQVEWEEAQSLSDDLSMLGKMPNDFVVDSTKIREQLGYQEILDENECYTDLVPDYMKSK